MCYMNMLLQSPLVFVSIVTVSIDFHLICSVRLCDCCGYEDVGCECNRFHAVDYDVFAEEVGFSGYGVGCDHVIVCFTFFVG